MFNKILCLISKIYFVYIPDTSSLWEKVSSTHKNYFVHSVDPFALMQNLIQTLESLERAQAEKRET